MSKVLPLFHFFETLQQNDFPLGIGEYESFLIALKAFTGLGVDDYNTYVAKLQEVGDVAIANAFPKMELLRLTKRLWLKPNQSEQLFEEIFEETYFLDFSAGAIATDTPAKDTRPEDSTTENKNTRDNTATSKTDDGKEVAESSQYDDNYLTGEVQSEQQAVSVSIAVSEYNVANDFGFERGDILEVEKSKFLFTQNYFPIDKRKIQQELKPFLSFQLANYSNEIDTEETIKKTIEKGYFDEIIFKQQRINTAHLLLLIDYGGSMVAFHGLTDILKSAIQRVMIPTQERKSKTFKSLYFTNTPGTNFYTNRLRTKAESLDTTIDQLKNKPASILVLSDAGASRGTYNIDRINRTNSFLKKLHSCTSKIAWLNPLQRERWLDTSAEEIAKYVAMFEISEKGLRNAVNYLKGNSTKAIIRNG